MKIRLVSRDRQVEKICREGLARLCDAEWSLYVDPEGRLDVAAELSILDLDTLSIPHETWENCNGTTHILLYSQELLDQMQGSWPAAMVLLKPLQRELFLTVLGCAVGRCRRRAEAAQAQAIEAEAAPEHAFGRPAHQAAAAEEAGELLQCLLQTSLELQRAHARQMHFLARGLHDLRAPLTAIEGYGGLLLAERFGPLTAAQRENLGRMQQSVARLSRMATDIFQLSLGERGEQTPDLQPGDLEHCIQRVMDEMMPVADAKQVQLAADVAVPAAPLPFDEAQIHNVLTNLLDNACRFSPRRGSIEVRGYPVFWERRRPQVREAREQERRLGEEECLNAYRVDIRDCGPGIPAEHLHSIFEPYTSYAGSQDRAGSGLGLAICRMVIGAHQGRIFAESGGGGAVFSFLLPFAEPLVGAERRPPRPEEDSASWSGHIAEETA